VTVDTIIGKEVQWLGEGRGRAAMVVVQGERLEYGAETVHFD
jgi:hypothetical protein